jgi:hypothetical protein
MWVFGRKILDLLQQAVEETHVGKHGFVYAADRDEVFALHPDRQGEAHESKDFILRAFFNPDTQCSLTHLPNYREPGRAGQ